MSRPDFDALRKELLASGLSPRHVRRAVGEIRDHFDDLVDAAERDGASRVAALKIAETAMGDLSAVAVAMRHQPELKSWAWHYPRLALVVYPIACVAALPAVPLRLGIEHAPTIGRWMACLAVSAFFTTLLFLVLQLSIQPSI